MNSELESLAEGRGRLLVLSFVALIAGSAAGLLGAAFRLALERADRLRGSLVLWRHFYCRRARPGYRHHPSYRDDGKLCVVSAHAGSLLRRHLVPTLLRNPTYDLLRSK